MKETGSLEMIYMVIVMATIASSMRRSRTKEKEKITAIKPMIFSRGSQRCSGELSSACSSILESIIHHPESLASLVVEIWTESRL